MVRIIAPKGAKGLQKFVEDWGEIIAKLHDQEERLVLESIYYTCKTLEEYEKGLLVFLKLVVALRIIQSYSVVSWYDEKIKKNKDCSLLARCENYLE